MALDIRIVMVKFLLVESEEYISTVQRIKEWKCIGKGDISMELELLPLENFIAQTTFFGDRKGRINVVNRGIQSDWGDLHR